MYRYSSYGDMEDFSGDSLGLNLLFMSGTRTLLLCSVYPNHNSPVLTLLHCSIIFSLKPTGFFFPVLLLQSTHQSACFQKDYIATTSITHKDICGVFLRNKLYTNI